VIPAPPPRRKPDATVALINVVFLMLIFFLIAGQLAPPLAEDLRLVDTGDLDPASPPDALVMRADGSLLFRGEATDPAAYLAALPAEERARVRIVPDRAAPAAALVEVAAALRTEGAEVVALVTEQGLQ
jgi:biopolymer transport protein ExbD